MTTSWMDSFLTFLTCLTLVTCFDSPGARVFQGNYGYDSFRSSTDSPQTGRSSIYLNLINRSQGHIGLTQKETVRKEESPQTSERYTVDESFLVAASHTHRKMKFREAHSKALKFITPHKRNLLPVEITVSSEGKLEPAETTSRESSEFVYQALDTNRQPYRHPRKTRSLDIPSSYSPCRMEKSSDQTIVDCSSLGLQDIQPGWFPPDTTQIILDNNQLVTLRGLFLDNNYDKTHKIDVVPFNDLFDKLSNLEIIHIEVNNENNLYLGKEFSRFKMLTTLIVNGGENSISGKTFENVPKISKLRLSSFDNVLNFSDDALTHLEFLSILEIESVHIGVKRSMLILKPLIGKVMEKIMFKRVESLGSAEYHGFITGDGIMDSSVTKYLTQICVAEVSLRHSDVYVLKPNTFTGEVWNRCLKSLDLSDNPLVGTMTAFSRILNLKSIQHLRIVNLQKKYYQEPLISKPPDDKNFVEHHLLHRSKDKSSVLQKEQIKKLFNDSNTQLLNALGKNKYNDDLAASKEICISHDWKLAPTVQIGISNSLITINLRRAFRSGGFSFNGNIMRGKNVRYLDFSECGFHDFNIKITGLEALQTLVFSGNNMSTLLTTFFDTFCQVETLFLSSCCLDHRFMQRNSARLFQRLPWLKHLDLSYNMLSDFSHDTFLHNNNLEIINLSKNRFKNIPFNLKYTSMLNFLDLRDNSVTSIDEDVRNNLDVLADNPHGLKLFLSGNVLSCDCNSLSFLNWLQTTKVQLDDAANFTCLNDRGQPDLVGSYDDLMAAWRICWGGFFLSLAISLSLFVTISFLVTFLLWKHRFYVKSYLMKLLTGHQLKLRSDYDTDVYVGYSETEYQFPCSELREYLEVQLGLSTYLYHRDMNPGTDMATCIMQPMNRSWRILLVFSESFLEEADQWSVFTYKSATFAQTSDNPARIVVLVDELLQDRLPLEVLSTVQDENIVVLSQWELTYHVREKLRSCFSLY